MSFMLLFHHLTSSELCADFRCQASINGTSSQRTFSKRRVCGFAQIKIKTSQKPSHTAAPNLARPLLLRSAQRTRRAQHKQRPAEPLTALRWTGAEASSLPVVRPRHDDRTASRPQRSRRPQPSLVQPSLIQAMRSMRRLPQPSLNE